MHRLLGGMHELAMILRERRLQARRARAAHAGGEGRSRQGRPASSGAHVVENTESHQIIEEFMLAANEAVAELLADAELHFLRRVHARARPAKAASADRVRHASWASRSRAWRAASSCRSC